MLCPQCQAPSIVTDSRPYSVFWKRRRKCILGHKWNTFEIPEEIARKLAEFNTCTICGKPGFRESDRTRKLCKEHFYKERYDKIKLKNELRKKGLK